MVASIKVGTPEEVAKRDDLIKQLSGIMEVDVKTHLAPLLPAAVSQEVAAEAEFSNRLNKANAAEKKAKSNLYKADKEIERIRVQLSKAEEAQRECGEQVEAARKRTVDARTAYDKAYPNPNAQAERAEGEGMDGDHRGRGSKAAQAVR